jgi:hypothetical protein
MTVRIETLLDGLTIVTYTSGAGEALPTTGFSAPAIGVDATTGVISGWSGAWAPVGGSSGITIIPDEASLPASPSTGQEVLVSGAVAGKSIPGRYVYDGALWIPSDTDGPCAVGGFVFGGGGVVYYYDRAADIVPTSTEPVFGPDHSFGICFYTESLVPPGNSGTLFGHGLDGSASGFMIRVGNNAADLSEMSIRMPSVPGDQFQLVGTSASAGAWHKLIVVVTAGGDMRWSFDGAYVGNNAAINWAPYGVPAATDNMRIGRGLGGEVLYGQWIADVAQWATALSDVDAAALTATPADGWIHGHAVQAKNFAGRIPRLAQQGGAGNLVAVTIPSSLSLRAYDGVGNTGYVQVRRF